MTAERAAATRVFAPPIVGVTYREQLQGCKASCAIKQACTPLLPEALLAGTQNRIVSAHSLMRRVWPKGWESEWPKPGIDGATRCRWRRRYTSHIDGCMAYNRSNANDATTKCLMCTCATCSALPPKP